MNLVIQHDMMAWNAAFVMSAGSVEVVHTLEDPYAPFQGRVQAPTLPTFTIVVFMGVDGLLFAVVTRRGTKAWMTATGPKTLTSYMSRKRMGSVSSMGQASSTPA